MGNKSFVNAKIKSVIEDNGKVLYEFENGSKVEAAKCFLTEQELINK